MTRKQIEISVEFNLAGDDSKICQVSSGPLLGEFHFERTPDHEDLAYAIMARLDRCERLAEGVEYVITTHCYDGPVLIGDGETRTFLSSQQIHALKNRVVSCQSFVFGGGWAFNRGG